MISSKAIYCISARQVLLQPAGSSDAERVAAERVFFRTLCLPDGTHKTTFPGRLRDLDDEICQLLSKTGHLRMLDVGISSGVTTLEWLERLSAEGRVVTGVGIDIRVDARLRRCCGLDVLYDPDGRVLQVAAGRVAMGRPDPSLRTWKALLLRAAFLTAELSVVRWWQAMPASSQKVALVCRALRERQGFDVVEHDVRLPVRHLGQFDVIRAANVLNLSYFPEPQLVRILHQLSAALSEGGLLAVCRTHGHDGSNHATIFRKCGRHLQPVHRLGTGSEIERLAAVAEALRNEQDKIANGA